MGVNGIPCKELTVNYTVNYMFPKIGCLLAEPVAPCFRGGAGLGAEELAEGGRVGETEFLAHLRHGLTPRSEHALCRRE